MFVRNHVQGVLFKRRGNDFLVDLRLWQTRLALIHRADSNPPSPPDRAAFLPRSNPNRIVVQLREHLAHPADIILQYSYEELFSNVVKNGARARATCFPCLVGLMTEILGSRSRVSRIIKPFASRRPIKRVILPSSLPTRIAMFRSEHPCILRNRAARTLNYCTPG